MNICDVGHRGKAAWRPGLETGALLSNAPSPSPEPLRVRGLEGSQGRFDLTDKTYLEQPPILAGQGSQSQSPGYLPTRVLAELWIAPRDPLYLFACSMLWHAEADVGASLNLPVDESWWRNGDPDLPHKEPESRRDSRAVDKVMTMNTPYGLEIIENCLSCKLRRKNWFCGLSPDVLKSFSAASHLSTYPGGAILFVEGQSPRGAFVLCSGKVKLSTTSREGKVLILKMAEAGEALGLSAVISATPYEVTAETSGPCQVDFIERETLMRMLEKNGELGLHSAQALSKEFQSAYRDIHELVLARSSAGKLARLLLSWTVGRENGSREIKIRSSLTHEEMAQMIGSSRETVTRLLSELRKKELIRLEGSTLVIRNRIALEALAA